MKLLSLDTSSAHFSLALTDNGKVLASRTMKNDRVLSSKMIPALEEVVKKSGMDLKDIDGISVGLGPGSFTSLRVGFATVKGLALALQKPVVGIPSFDSIAARVKRGEEDQLCVIFDAKRDLVYAAIYERGNGVPFRSADFLLIGLKDLLKKVRGAVLFTGDGLLIYRDQILKQGQRKGSNFKAAFLEEKFWYPSAEQIAVLAAARFRDKDSDPINALLPLYLYPQDCQVRR